MNRRKFIKLANKGLVGTVVSVGLASIVKAQEGEGSPVRYIDIPEPQTTEDFSIWVDIFKSGVKSFATASDAQKQVQIIVQRFSPKADGSQEMLSGTYIFAITKVESTDFEGKYKVEAEYKDRVKGNSDLPDDFPASPIKMWVNMTDEMFLQKSLVIYDEAGKDYKICLTPKQSGGMGCFITSACTESKGLADDCWELQTMRSLRDDYILKLPEGEKLIEEYYQIAPKMVDRIDAQDNSKDAYSFIYDTLIIPATGLHAKGKSQEAMNYYRDYVWEMKNLFN